MDNKDRAKFTAREYTAEEMIFKMADAAEQMSKAAKDVAEYLKATANANGKDAQLGALSRVFVAETGRVAALTEVLEETFLGSGIEVEKELSAGRLFEETMTKLKAEKAAKEKAFFEQSIRQN